MKEFLSTWPFSKVNFFADSAKKEAQLSNAVFLPFYTHETERPSVHQVDRRPLCQKSVQLFCAKAAHRAREWNATS